MSNDAHGDCTSADALVRLQLGLAPRKAISSHEAALACALQTVGLGVVAIDPRMTRDFARAMHRSAKTDRIDVELAGALSRGPDAERFTGPVGEPEQQDLTASGTRQRPLFAMWLSERQRLRLTRSVARSGIEADKRRFDDVEAEMTRHVEQHRATLAMVLQGVVGIGKVATTTLIAELPEFGRLDRRWICALAGVAQYTRNSSSRQDRRRVGGGRLERRRALYIATRSAVRQSPPIRDFSGGLVAAGEPKTAALTSCMRKWITALNATASNHHDARDRLPAD